jgi:hypothetical protein
MLQAARLWARRSARGTDYFSGRMGLVKLVILPNRDFDPLSPANSHSHTLFFSDSETRAPQPAPAEHAQAQPSPVAPARKRARPRGGPKQRLPDDLVPF